MEIERLHQVKEELDGVSPSFCLAKWYQATLHLFNGSTQSCHHVNTHRVPLEEIAKSPSALHNSSFKKSVREQMKSGKFPSECQYCWKIEAVGQYSDRIHKSSEHWARPGFQEASRLPASADVFPTYLEIAFDNICNFKCMYCSPAFSSSWDAEIRQHGPYPTSRLFNNLWQIKYEKKDRLEDPVRSKYMDAFWTWWPELSNHLHDLRVTGGEPLLSKDMWQLLDSLAEDPRPHLTFSLNSNLGLPPAMIDKLLAKFAKLEGKVKKVILYTSVDSVGSQAEYIRHGLKYERLMGNVRKILTESAIPIRLSYMITVNALSLPGLRSLLQTIHAQRQEFKNHEIGLDTPYLNHPEHLSVLVLPKSYETYLEEALAFMRTADFYPEEIQRLERVLELMRSSRFKGIKKHIMQHDFRVFMREHDRRRGTNFKKTFPEYRSMIRPTPWALLLPWLRQKEAAH